MNCIIMVVSVYARKSKEWELETHKIGWCMVVFIQDESRGKRMQENTQRRLHEDMVDQV